MTKTDRGIVLIIPQNPSTTGIVSGAYGVTAPLGVGYIASYLKKHDFKVSILDNNIERLSREDFKTYLRKIKPGYIGLSLLTSAVNNAISLSEAAKEVNSQIKVIAGGPHASALPRDVLHQEAIDLVVKGEGEVTALELLKAFENNQSLNSIKGIVYKDDGKIIENPNRELIADIDNLPLPAYELLPMDKYYLSATRRLYKGGVGSIITSRGCPQRCSFCSRAVFGQTVRYRSPESVVSEIRYLVDNYSVREILFWDDTFTLNKTHAIEISRLIAKYLPGLIWSCYSRANHAGDSFYGELYKGGCRQLSFGMESGSQAILDSIHKDIDLQDIENAIQYCRKNKIMSFCCFVFGFPGETKDTIIKTIRLAKKINPDFVSFCILTPLPGSDLFNQALDRGLINLKNIQWDHFVCLLSTVRPPVSMCSLDQKKLVWAQRKAFREFYFRPRYILGSLGRMKSKEFIYQAWRGFNAIFKHQLHRFMFE